MGRNDCISLLLMIRRLNKKAAPLEKGSRVVSKEEKNLWNQVTEDIEPLANPNGSIDLINAGTGQKRPLNSGQPLIKRPPLSSQSELLHGAAPGLDRATQQKMRRGKVIIEARIDLHGMTQNEAYQALGAFLHDCWFDGLRSVLVITGKGVGGGGVLRAAVPRWLNENNNRQMVRAFSFAVPKDGGEGALYVMLKRLK